MHKAPKTQLAVSCEPLTSHPSSRMPERMRTGTAAVASSWRTMSASVIRALRPLVILMLLIAATGGHGAAMAGDVNPHASMHHSAQMMDHGGAHGACMDTACDPDTTSCCVMGKCLLGVILASDVHFRYHPPLRPSPEPVPVLAALVGDDHFRPPAAA